MLPQGLSQTVWSAMRKACCMASSAVVMQVRNVRGEWREIAMSKHIKALVVLNLQSYAGGRDLWGLRDPKRDAAKGWQTPIFNDGVIEVRRMPLQRSFWGIAVRR